MSPARPLSDDDDAPPIRLGIGIPRSVGITAIATLLVTIVSGTWGLAIQYGTQAANNTATNLRIDRIADAVNDQRAQLASDEKAMSLLSDRIIKLESQYGFLLSSQAGGRRN